MPSLYDQLDDLRIQLRQARFDNNEAGICVIETRIDMLLDQLPRTGRTADPHGTT